MDPLLANLLHLSIGYVELLLRFVRLPNIVIYLVCIGLVSRSKVELAVTNATNAPHLVRLRDL